MVPIFWINLNPFIQGCFGQILVEIGPVVLEKMMKMWKVYDNDNDNDKDDFWSEKLTWAKKCDREFLSTWISFKQYPNA